MNALAPTTNHTRTAPAVGFAYWICTGLIVLSHLLALNQAAGACNAGGA